MCPIIHFLVIVFADNVFHQDLTSHGLTAEKMHSFQNPEGRITIEFRFRDKVFDIPVFCSFERCLIGIYVYPTRALSASVISPEVKRLGQRAGLSYPFKPYCLRREVGTELTGQFS